jgi:hypothetical protein
MVDSTNSGHTVESQRFGGCLENKCHVPSSGCSYSHQTWRHREIDTIALFRVYSTHGVEVFLVEFGVLFVSEFEDWFEWVE